MAKERGAFPVFDLSREKDHVFVSRVVSELSDEMQEMYLKHGRRNIANLTIAPAGSMSMMAQLGPFHFGTTSGCEPAFRAPSYKRRKKIMSGQEDARVDFVDELGDKWQEFIVYHPGHLHWAEVNGMDPQKDIEKSPYWQASSADIDWVKKVEMQAAAQRWIDHSISNTTNVPKDVTVETVKQIYMRGWETGCKGITIYRDGSRSGVMVSEDSKDNTRGLDSIQETQAPKRPETLPCDIHRAKVKGKEYLILVGLLAGKPYEIFCGLAESMEIGKREKSGSITKVPRASGIASYNLTTERSEEFKDIVNLFDNPEYGAFTRTLSTSLRHGVPVQYVVEQLRKDKHSTLTSFSSVIARVLGKSYIADGTKSSASKSCPDCGSTNLAYQQGCVSCIDCGSSKCG
jgi:ribonucleoside-diphosphate reductase alpha chain